MGEVKRLPLQMIRNALSRSNLASMFPGYFTEIKHNHYEDFGWPTHLNFQLFYDMYCRNGLAAAAVKKTTTKCWIDNPTLIEGQRTSTPTRLERDIAQRFQDLRVWQRLAETDRRSLVGRYSAVILRFADNRRFSDPVDTVPGGLAGLVEVIPAWEGQLTVGEWDTDPESETYGQPAMYNFNEAQVNDTPDQTRYNRTFNVHPDRVIIWSENGTIHGQSLLEPGYNELKTAEKISGAGGEGFWRNAKNAPHLKLDSESSLDTIAQSMGLADKDALLEAMNEQVEDWQKGFDKLLLTQGIDAQQFTITLPSPEHFYSIAVQSFAASIEMPVKVLTGMQTGERASQEDQKEWSETCQARRVNVLEPNIRSFIQRLEDVNIIPEREYAIEWADLTESSMPERIDRARNMSEVNRNMFQSGELVFTAQEIRETVGLDPEGAEDLDQIDEDDAPPPAPQDDEGEQDD